ncbi:SMP-30/gluconolactonase/LRE family protein [Aestuariirhabdus sp. Z084]|uniref:SMP-30/gluconolactonase/LRE family protein n=1 Tax=Aestuariirhabdus haliotis TaxID=2918751 RepID=UPI00201B4238|nr:SMP-30/gluconolactonase/LRE family protein [Aestuariirhabdus haliotis]MCL6416499.1 SMP-30/gluconolactonase/LRE family protein [Aestuariirhabdus haliotis]MCL6420489.1 SMP-30/gluconolactonase/LRE family protein [Aestuariirhabdus haliotis]
MTYQLANVLWRGTGLVRPECVLTTARGYIYVSDFRGGVTEIAPSGEQQFFGGSAVGEYGILKPNGIALLENGDFLIAHLGDTLGGIFRISRNNDIDPFLTEVDGEPLPPSNFVYLDRQGRIWITVSTRHQPRAKAYRADIADGFIVVIENNQARIVADKIGYTNELYVDPDGSYLYVNATFTRELLRYRIGHNSSLHDKHVVTRFEAGTYPDGLTRDIEGNFWVTSIVSNRIIKITPDGEQNVVLQDVDPQHLDWVEQAYQSHSMGRPHLDKVKSQTLQNISSLAFGGEQMNTLHLGCLLGEKIAVIESNIEGIKPAHWEFDNHRQ